MSGRENPDSAPRQFSVTAVVTDNRLPPAGGRQFSVTENPEFDEYMRRKAQREAREALQAKCREAGAAITEQRQRRECFKGRPEAEVCTQREQAAQSATICGDCFQPLAPRASATMVWRLAEIIPMRYAPSGHAIPKHERWLWVPICVLCWIDSRDERRARWPFEESPIWRRRCLTCRRPLRIYHSKYTIHGFLGPYQTEQVCCDDCHRAWLNRRARERRRIQHEPIKCARCGNQFTPKRAGARVCSARCRQALHRRR